jgi:biofilm PGA synthesis N-glycosyltransferase PgaC
MPARNEEAAIGFALASIVRQTHLPKALIIALNDCRDRTAEAAEPFLRDYPWITLYRHDFQGARNYANKARVFQAAMALLPEMKLDYIGNVDADVSLPPDYYQKVLERFEADPRLGVAGGVFYETRGGKETPNFDWYERSVVGMAQLFRMECYRDIGGYRPIATGGVDMAADIMARYRGWRTRSFPEIRFLHHRRLGTAESNLLRAKYMEGVRDYHMGYGFLFHALKCLRRIAEQPYIIGSAARMAAYLAGALGNGPMALNAEERAFLRSEQLGRIRSTLLSLIPHGLADLNRTIRSSLSHPAPAAAAGAARSAAGKRSPGRAD